MQLVSFSVTNYRSITTAYKLPVKQATILIGPNNEGKSNILRALVTALEALKEFGGGRITSAGRVRSGLLRIRPQSSYSWQRDFPVSLQEKMPLRESTFNLEFQLDDQEVDEFYSEVKSSLNGTLPIQLTLGQKEPTFRVTKKGPGGPALSKKAEAIANYVAKRININYIPAVRTAEAAADVVSRIVERELTVVEDDPSFHEALSKVEELQQPVLERISGGIRDTLKEFLPNVKQVRVSIPPDARTRALRRSVEIVVDDGTPTLLSRKGDGVQSLAALSLMRETSSSGAAERDVVLAIEEPESHLHPNAIHQLKAVLNEIATKHQVILTTHCPLFVDRTSIKSNIIVKNRKAAPARDIKQIREVLGVRASDNLQHAELILLVEGDEDQKALRSLLTCHSKTLASALAQGALALDSLQGSSNLAYKVALVREALCVPHSFLDNDDSGRSGFERAKREGLLTLADVNLVVCPGMNDSEIEDMYEESIYESMVLSKYGVSLQSPKFKGRGKWSDRLKAAFQHQGKPWTDQIEMEVKLNVGALIEADPASALNVHKRSSFDALILTLENKLVTIAAGKR